VSEFCVNTSDSQDKSSTTCNSKGSLHYAGNLLAGCFVKACHIFSSMFVTCSVKTDLIA